MASKEVSLCSPGLNWASINRGLVQGQSECINVGFGGVLDLREASKGEVVTVGVALHSIGYSFFFSGIGKTLTSSKGISARSRKGTLRGSEPVKVSLGL